MKKTLLLLILFIFIPFAAFADEELDGTDYTEATYLYIGFGSSYTMYQGELNNLIDGPTWDYTINWEMLHLYFPLGKKFIIGIAIDDVIDVYDAKTVAGEDVKLIIHQYFAGFSAMLFFYKKIGLGPFLRAEAGLSRIILTEDIGQNTKGSLWGYGYGVLAGGGYAFRLTEGSSFLINVNYAYKYSVDINKTPLISSSINLTAGILW